MTWEDIIKESKDLLVVENSWRRIKATYKRILPWFVVPNLEDLEFILNNVKIQTLWLDYDLTRIWKIGHRVNTLATINKYKGTFKERGIKLIVIHSWNPWGRWLLKRALKGTGIKVILKRHWKMF
ncbi:MAG: hypothetical protein WCX20_01655 [Candidatus Shapirobacteria bacterium]